MHATIDGKIVKQVIKVIPVTGFIIMKHKCIRIHPYPAVVTVSYDLDVVDEDAGNIQFEVKASTGVFNYNIVVTITTMAGSATGYCIDILLQTTCVSSKALN